MTPTPPAPHPRELAVHPTAIPGLLIVDLPQPGDARGWFKENWQRAKMTALGLPDFGPVQHSVAHNTGRGVTRGFHAEPWDKFISLAAGRIFGAWVDLREGPTFGEKVTLELGTDQAVFVPRGVGNSYQTLTDHTVYSYLVNDHWSPAARDSYTYLNLADAEINITWPIPLENSIRSDADLAHPTLDHVVPMPPRPTLIIGAGGQLGRALATALPHATAVDRDTLDLADPASINAFDFTRFGVIINAAAHTAVDHAETPQGRAEAWAINTTALTHLVAAARQARATLVHISSDYVFDGTRTEHDEDEPPSPLGVYGQTKAAGDAIIATWPNHYIVRTSWVIGDGHNFVATMARLAHNGATPTVVNDQHGRLTFTTDLAAGIIHLITSNAPHGTYNLTNTGPIHTWADIATHVFTTLGRNPDDVTPITTQTWIDNTHTTTPDKPIAPRPTHSTLTLDKITATGFTPPPAQQRLDELLATLRDDG